MKRIGIFKKYDYICKYGKRPCYPHNGGAIDLRNAVYRGAAPTTLGRDPERVLQWLKRKGVRTVALMCKSEQNTDIDAEIALINTLGMTPEHFDWGEMIRQKRAGREPIWERLLKLTRAGGLYIHCIWGADRTGAAVGRLRTELYGWPVADAGTELCVYGFSGRLEREALSDGYIDVLRYFDWPVSQYEPVREGSPYFPLVAY